ncbi:MAG: UDP-glucuronic acid decarboxylase family protein [bacterium]
MPTALVTGGCGFLGSHLCDYLLKKDYRVICIDNLITGDIENISPIRNPRFLYIKQDVTNYIYLGEQVDYIYHFASPASPIDYLKHPIPTLKVGSLGTHHVLGLAKAHKSRILIASTSEVYGDPLIHPQPEDYWGNVNPIGPRGVYDEAKRFAEAMTMAYHNFHGVETRIARIFNTFGPRMRVHDGRAVTTFMRQALLGEDITVFGDGSQTRSFCYYSDLIEGIYRLMMSEEELPVNIGNPTEMTVKEMAETVLKLVGGPGKLVYRPLPVNDPKVRQPDISKARKLLNWEPEVDLMEGLGKTLDWMKKKLSRQ